MSISDGVHFTPGKVTLAAHFVSYAPIRLLDSPGDVTLADFLLQHFDL